MRIAGSTGGEAVIEEVAGPNEEGTSWLLNLRLRDDESGEPVVLDEVDVEPTGFAENDVGERVPLGADDPMHGEPADRLELRLFTEITDGIEAARVAETIERELADLLGGATVTIEAERHWSEPYNYELAVSVVPHGDPVEALEILAEAGGAGWLAYATTAGGAISGGARRATRMRCWSCPRCTGRRSPSRPGPTRPVGRPRTGRSSSWRSPTTSPRTPILQTRSRAMKKPDVPCRCGLVSRNSGRVGCAKAGHSSPSGSGSSPVASTTASFSSAFSVQTE